jgi:TolB-like protein/tetratricopeptide (TPR) repeat protein
LSRLPDPKTSDEAIREEVDRILRSPIFAQSDRLARFLRFTVERALEGQGDALKEYVIGTEVYDRRPPYHPSQDSIVRTEARRLRSKLKEYYEIEGKDDPIFIFFRSGSYAPVFRSKDADRSDEAVAEAPEDSLFVEGAGIGVAVIPFLDLSGQPLSARYALGITDELIHELNQSEGCRGVSIHSIAHLGPLTSDAIGLAAKLRVQILFEGTVREEGNRIRVTGRIVNADGFQLWSQRLDSEADAAEEFEMQEQFASALVSRVRPQVSAVRTERASAGPLLLSLYPTLLKASSQAEEGTVSDAQGALKKFQEVAQAAPSYARPFCGIARCQAWMALHGVPRASDHVTKARIAAETALRLDSHMADALASIGAVQALEWQWEQAEASMRKAAEHRSHAFANRQLAMLLVLLGRFDEAFRYLDAAQRIDPFSYRQKAARARFFYLSRRYEDAVEQFAEPQRYGPIPLDAQLDLAQVYAAIEKYETALRLAQQAQRDRGGDLATLSLVAEIHCRCQDREAAETLSERHGLLQHEAGLSRYRQARLATALDQHKTAMQLLAASYADKEPELAYLSVEPGFDAIRSRPEFVELVKAVKGSAFGYSTPSIV